MQAIETQVFKFDELSDQAKAKVIENYRQRGWDNFDTECIIEDFAEICRILGIELEERTVRLMNGKTRGEPAVYWSGFWSQGDGACFEGYYRYRKGSVAGINNYAPMDEELLRIAKTLQDAQRRYFYKLVARVTHTGHYYHSHSVSINVEHDKDQYLEIDQGVEDAIEQSLRDLMDWLYARLEDEYEYQNSDDFIAEILDINEYKFEEDGTLI